MLHHTGRVAASSLRARAAAPTRPQLQQRALPRRPGACTSPSAAVSLLPPPTVHITQQQQRTLSRHPGARPALPPARAPPRRPAGTIEAYQECGNSRRRAAADQLEEHHLVGWLRTESSAAHTWPALASSQHPLPRKPAHLHLQLFHPALEVCQPGSRNFTLRRLRLSCAQQSRQAARQRLCMSSGGAWKL